MSSALVLVEVLRGTARRPVAWWIVATMWFAWLGLERFMPLGLVTEGLHRSTAHYEVAFVGGCACILFAAGPVARLNHVLRPAGAARRTALEIASLFTVGAVTAALVVVPAQLFDQWQYPDFEPVRSAAAGALALLHFAALTVLLAVRGAGRGDERREWGVPAAALAAFAVPALLTGETGVGRFALHALDVGRPLRISFDFPLSWAQWGGAMLPTLALGALACAVISPARSPGS